MPKTFFTRWEIVSYRFHHCTQQHCCSISHLPPCPGTLSPPSSFPLFLCLDANIFFVNSSSIYIICAIYIIYIAHMIYVCVCVCAKILLCLAFWTTLLVYINSLPLPSLASPTWISFLFPDSMLNYFHNLEKAWILPLR